MPSTQRYHPFATRRIAARKSCPMRPGLTAALERRPANMPKKERRELRHRLQLSPPLTVFADSAISAGFIGASGSGQFLYFERHNDYNLKCFNTLSGQVSMIKVVRPTPYRAEVVHGIVDTPCGVFVLLGYWNEDRRISYYVCRAELSNAQLIVGVIVDTIESTSKHIRFVQCERLRTCLLIKFAKCTEYENVPGQPLTPVWAKPVGYGAPLRIDQRPYYDDDPAPEDAELLSVEVPTGPNTRIRPTTTFLMPEGGNSFYLLVKRPSIMPMRELRGKIAGAFQNHVFAFFDQNATSERQDLYVLDAYTFEWRMVLKDVAQDVTGFVANNLLILLWKDLRVMQVYVLDSTHRLFDKLAAEALRELWPHMYHKICEKLVAPHAVPTRPKATKEYDRGYRHGIKSLDLKELAPRRIPWGHYNMSLPM